jgi:hypothetical protein
MIIYKSRILAATLLCALGAATIPTAANAATYTVSTAAELSALLQSVRTDTTILLNPGNYGSITILDVRSAKIRIASRLATDRAVFKRVYVRFSSNIRFDQVNFNGPRLPGETDTVSGVMVRQADNIHFTNARFHGSMNGDANDDGILLRFLDSSNGIVLNSEFREARVAVGASNSTNMQLIGNNVSLAREGFNFSGVNNVFVDRNIFTNIRPNTAEGDHSDAIQFYTGTAVRPNTVVQITNNVMLLPHASVQGIFVRNEKTLSTLNPRTFHIANNLYFGTVRNGIFAANVKGVNIKSNTLMYAPNFIYEAGVVMRDCVDATASNNTTPFLLEYNTAPTVFSNVILKGARTPGVLPSTQFTGNTAVATATMAAFGIVAGSTSAVTPSGFRVVGDIGGMTLASATTRYTSAVSRTAATDSVTVTR